MVLLFFDATERISKVDKQLCDYIAQQYKPCIFVVNKWDLIVNIDADREVGPLSARHFSARCCYAPIAFITGQTGKNVKALLNHAQMLFKQSLARVGTGQLNRMLARRDPPQSAAALKGRAAEDLLRHASRRAAADDRALLQCADRRSREPTSATCSASFATS